MPIKINFLANTRDAVRNVGDIGDALSDVSESLDDVARDAARSGSKISDAYSDAAKDGERAAERLERSFKDASDATARNGVSGPEKFAKTTKESAEEANESVRTFKDEAKSNLSEVASSFDGSTQSIVDLFQGTLGGVVADLGPIGLAAGALAAAGVGLIGAKIQQTEADQEALRQKASELADEYIETGRVGETSVGFIADAMRDLATETEQGQDSLSSLRKEAENAGVSVKDYQLANAGAAENTKRALQEAREEYQKLADKAQDDSLTKAEQAKQIALGNTIGTLLDLQQAQDDAKTSAKDYFDSGADAAAAAGQAAEDYSSAVQSAYADAGSSIEQYVEKGVFNLDKYQQATQKNLDAIVGYQKNMSEAQGILAQEGHDTALQYLEQLGPDAAPLIDAFVKAPAAKQQELAAIWDQLGSTGASSFGNRLQRDLDAAPAKKTVTVVPDMAEFNRAMADATKQREAHIKAYLDAPRGVQGMGIP